MALTKIDVSDYEMSKMCGWADYTKALALADTGEEELTNYVKCTMDNLYANRKIDDYTMHYYDGANMDVLPDDEKYLEKLGEDLYYGLENFNVHNYVNSKIEKFLGSEQNSCLNISYGFGKTIYQMIPQDEEYIAHLKKFRKNVILAFDSDAKEQIDPGSGGEYSGKFPELVFNISHEEHFDKRLRQMLLAADLITADTDINIELYENKALFYTWSLDGNEYIFIWVRSYLIPLNMMLYYKENIRKFRQKNLVEALTYHHTLLPKFYKDYGFNYRIHTVSGEHGTHGDIRKFKQNKNTIGILRASRENIQTGEIKSGANLWNGLIAGARRRKTRRTKGKKRLTRRRSPF
jgi:hypothetical protein